MDKVETDKTAAGSPTATATDLKTEVVAPQPSRDRIEQLEADKKRLQGEVDELTAWQRQAVEKAESIFSKHQQLLKELRSSKTALSETEARLSAQKREVDSLRMDFKNLQQALSKAEQEARKSREIAAELEQCKKRLVENTPKSAV